MPIKNSKQVANPHHINRDQDHHADIQNQDLDRDVDHVPVLIQNLRNAIAEGDHIHQTHQVAELVVQDQAHPAQVQDLARHHATKAKPSRPPIHPVVLQ